MKSTDSLISSCRALSKAQAACYRPAGHHQKHGQPVTVVPGTIKSTDSLLSSCPLTSKAWAVCYRRARRQQNPRQPLQRRGHLRSSMPGCIMSEKYLSAVQFSSTSTEGVSAEFTMDSVCSASHKSGRDTHEEGSRKCNLLPYSLSSIWCPLSKLYPPHRHRGQMLVQRADAGSDVGICLGAYYRGAYRHR